MSKPKKHRHEEHEEHQNHEAWVIPYADMLTLLMAMFLVLWAIGQVDVSKAKAVSTGFSDEFGLSTSPGAGAGGVGVLDGVAKQDNAVQPKPKIDKNQPITPVKEDSGDGTGPGNVDAEALKQLQQVQQAIDAAAAGSSSGAGFETQIGTRQEVRGLVVSIVDGALFLAGSAELTAHGKVVLDELAPELTDIPNQLLIEGHTDNQPISNGQFRSNTFLSSARASVVYDYLHARHGIPTDRLAVSGYGDTKPIGDNATAGGRARNRRVDIAILNTANDAADATDTSPAPPTGATHG